MRVKPRCLLLQQLEERGKSAEVQVAKSLPCLYLQGILGKPFRFRKNAIHNPLKTGLILRFPIKKPTRLNDWCPASNQFSISLEVEQNLCSGSHAKNYSE